jgi:hypothetical protein
MASAVKPHFLLSLGRHSQQASDERNLICDVLFFQTMHLPFPDLASLQRVPWGLKRKEAQPCFEASFTEAMILVNDVVEIVDLPQFTEVGNGSLRLQFVEGLERGRIFVDSDHPRGGGVRRSQRFCEAAFACASRVELRKNSRVLLIASPQRDTGTARPF